MASLADIVIDCADPAATVAATVTGVTT